METVTIDISSILYYVLPYYILLNIFSILIGNEIKYNISNILCILNPFREFSINKKDQGFSAFALLMFLTLIPYTVIMISLYFILKYNYNIIW